MATTSKETKISLKIFVDREKNRVVFAEADCSFVDILFSFMTLPIGTIARLLREHSDQKSEAPRGISTLYKTVTDLPVKIFCSEECKLTLLNPVNPSEDLCKKLKLNIDDRQSTKYYRCNSPGCNQRKDEFVSPYKGTKCCHCGTQMSREISLDSIYHGFSFDGAGVFVKDTTTFIITDDLHVMPNNPGSIIQLLKGLGITDFSQLEERTVDLGLQEIRDLLQWALACKSPLTHLFTSKTNTTLNTFYPDQGKPDQLLSGEKTATNSKYINLKFTRQKSTDKILFLVMDQNYVDLVISFLTVPLGTSISKLNGTISVGSIDNLYSSILNMSVEGYMKSQDSKDMLLQPHMVPHLRSGEFMFKYQDPIAQRGFINGPALFLATNVFITPLSSVSVLDFLKKFNVPISDIEEYEVMMGIEEGLKVLKVFLKFSPPLTDVIKRPLKKPKQES